MLGLAGGEVDLALGDGIRGIVAVVVLVLVIVVAMAVSVAVVLGVALAVVHRLRPTRDDDIDES